MVVEHNRRRICSGSSMRSLGRKWEDVILPGRKNPRNCVDPPHLGKIKWDQKLGKIECAVLLYDKMRWRWDEVYLPRGLPNMYSPLLSPPPLPLYPRSPALACGWWTWRLWSSDLRDALGGRDRVSSEIHSEAIIQRVWRCTWRPRFTDLRDALWGHDRASLEMQLESEIEWTQRCTGRPWSSEFGHSLVEEYLEAVDLEGGATAAETLFIGQLAIVGM